jgi:glutamate racemase
MRSKPQGKQAISSSSPIGVFDSGVGGMTVLRALLDRLPGEDFVYLGDTARLPYGTKSPGSIRQYSLQAARLLQERGVKCLVVACNTASAIALDALTHEFDPVPVIGVLEPGAAAACLATRSGRIAVLATESTVRGGAYQAAITRRRPDAIVTARACPLFVALAEEGWTDGPIVEGVIHRYLDDVFVAGSAAAHPDTLVLGCTHFPVLAPTLRKVLGPEVAIVDSAATTAISLADVLAERGVLRHDQAAGSVMLLATDGPERFARVGAVFLGRPLAPADVQIVDLAYAPAPSGA